MSKMKSKMRSKPSHLATTIGRGAGRVVGLVMQIRRIGFLGGLVLALVGGTIYASQNQDQLSTAMAKIGFSVDDITLVGRYRTQRQDIIRVLEIAPGAPILAIDLAEKRARLELLPWVKTARIVRRLPNLLHVELIEFEPFARLLRDGDTSLIDRRGQKIISDNGDGFRHLPIMRGAGAEYQAAALLDLLDAYPVIRNRLTAAHWVQGRRWTLTLDHGGRVLLPELQIADALDRLMQLEQERRILAVGDQTIDLRLDDRVLLRPAKFMEPTRDKEANA
jgi:cell division protein FtsQ